MDVYRDSDYGNALQAASLEGHKGIVRLLLDKGVGVNPQGGICGTASQVASLGGHQEVVRLILDKKANVNVQGGRYGNAVQVALSEAIKKLLDCSWTRERTSTRRTVIIVMLSRPP
jgi:ankyrin repeat protein